LNLGRAYILMMFFTLLSYPTLLTEVISSHLTTPLCQRAFC
jgi:hypothetical protein